MRENRQSILHTALASRLLRTCSSLRTNSTSRTPLIESRNPHWNTLPDSPRSRHIPMECPEVVPVTDRDVQVHTVFEASTQTWQWVVADPDTRSALIIDPVLDYAPRHQGICTTAADNLLGIVRQHGYRVVRILETHAQRECQTAAWYLRTQLRDPDGNMPRICTGKSIAGVQRMFARQYKIHDAGWARHFDAGFRDGQIFNFGHLTCQVMQLDANCFAFVIGRNVFLGEVPGQAMMQRLGGFTEGYCWHPGTANESRPVTAATTVTSGWATPRPSLSVSGDSTVSPYSPLTPTDHAKRFGQKTQTAVHEMQG